jgi:hypothetical protein
MADNNEVSLVAIFLGKSKPEIRRHAYFSPQKCHLNRKRSLYKGAMCLGIPLRHGGG